MATPGTVLVSITRLEAAYLAELVEQFADLVASPVAGSADPALDRLTPDAYSDDAEAAREFRRLTRGDLLSRRAEDATMLIDTLRSDGEIPAPQDVDPDTAGEEIALALDATQSTAWMRTLSAVRLVMASRLGIETEADAAEVSADPRFGVYEWLGYRLDTLVTALDSVD